jgi:hypothetical protein
MITRNRFTILLTLLAALSVGLSVQAQGFKFSDPDPSEKADKDAQDKRNAQVQEMLAAPCLSRIKNQKIMVVIAENKDGFISANQAVYNTHVSAINDRLQGVGLRTFTPAQIRAQVAQAEINAFFKNDPDAAISASRRLAAQYILRGVITSNTHRNAIVNVNQVSIGMKFTLTGANGRMISQASANNESYAGHDVAGMALTLVEESAEEVVAKLYSDHCKAAGVK